VKLTSIHIDGFGCLLDATFELAPGLNVFFGDNESGKSTLQQAIWAFLYGFYKGDRKLARDTEVLNRYRPWSGKAFGGNIVYTLDSGKAYKVARDFGRDELRTSVSEVDTGRDVTKQFQRGKLGRVDFAQRQFGVSEEVFINTCFVRQADLRRLADAAQEISETVINLSGTGSQDRSVKKALERLDETHREQVGTARARTKPQQAVQDKLAGLRRELEEVQAQRDALQIDYERRTVLLKRRQDAAQRIAHLKYLLAAGQRDRLATRIERLDGLHLRKDELRTQIEGLKELAAFPLSERESMSRLYQEWMNAQRDTAKVGRAAEAAGPERAALTQQRLRLREEIQLLDAARNVPLGHEPAIRALDERRRRALSDVEGARAALESTQAALSTMEPVRERASSGAVLLRVGPQALHDLGIGWNSVTRDLEVATEELGGAERAWRTQPLALEAFQELHNRLGTFSYETLATLKGRKAEIDSKTEASKAKAMSPMRWVLAGVALVALLGGMALLLLAFIANSPTALVAGSVAVGLGLVAGVIALSRVLRTQSKPNADRNALPTLRAEVVALGFETLDELEASYQVYLQARPLYDQLTRAETMMRDRRENLAKIVSAGREMLELAPGTPLALSDVQAAEREAIDLTERLEDLRRVERERDQDDSQLQEAQEALSQVEAKLRVTLVLCGLGEGDLGDEVDRFYGLCEERRRLERVEADRRTLDATSAKYETVDEEHERERVAEEAARSRLEAELRRLGFSGETAEQAFREFESCCDRAETLHQLQQDSDALAREIDGIVIGHSPDQLQMEQSSASLAAQEMLTAEPTLASLTSDETPEELQRKLGSAIKEDGETSAELASIVERISLVSAGSRCLAEVEEEIQSAEETSAALSFHGEALLLAREQLAEAADEHYRDFLPRLNAIVGDGLSVVTDKKYTEVQIDHADLQVLLPVPDLAMPVSAEVLSRGAQEQVYLLLRLGLAELMSGGGERLPLVLDDPLVNWDASRFKNALELLAERAERTQVLVFTKDRATVDWFKSKYSAKGDHGLHMLSAY
jgi:DNA repair exonuclease SbcCD ATPase subunit